MDLSDRAKLMSPTFNRLMPDEREEYVEAMLHAHDVTCLHSLLLSNKQCWISHSSHRSTYG